MNIGGLHQRFKNRLGVTNGYGDLLPHEIDSKLNEAASWIVAKYGNMDAEQSFVKNLLSPFFKSLDVTFKVVEEEKLYELEIPSDSEQIERLTYKCKGNDATVDITTHDNLSTLLGDALLKPSKVFNRSIAVIEDGKLILHTAQKLTTGKLVYLRKPKPVFYGGYDTAEYLFCTENGQGDCNKFYNQNSDPVNSEFLDNHQELLVDIAVFLESGKIINSAINRLVSQKIAQ